MRIAVPQGAKLYPVDRNPLNVLRFHTQQLTGPVAITTVWSYTVPTARAFLAGLVYLRQTVVAPATLVHYANLWIYIAGQVAFTSFMIEDAAGNQDRQNIPIGVTFLPGVSFSAQKEIQSGATVWQEVGMMGIEFDR